TVGQALIEGFQQIIRTEEALAGMRGEAAELAGTYQWMVEILDDHAATLQQGSEEWLQVVEAANRYRALIGDLPEFTLGGFSLPAETKTATQALRENHEWLLRMAAAQDTLRGTQTDLSGTYSMLIDEQRLLIRTLEEGSEEWLQAVETLARYETALAGLREGSGGVKSGVDAWAQSVQRIGVELDPVATMSAELGVLMDEGEITAEQYAIGLELVADALDRIEQAEAAAQVEKVTAAWKAAGAQLADMLGVDLFDVVDSQWDEMRKAAKAAFDAGIIGADELAKALKAIDIHEV